MMTLTRRSSLKRDTAKALAFANKGRTLRKVSTPRAKLNRERREIRERVFVRDGYRCQANWPATECFGPLTVHHLKKASAGGTYTEGNLVTTCSHHNSLIEDFPITAQSLGLVIRSKESS